MRELLWKEWHEQAWKLGFGCVVLGTIALMGLRSRLLADQTTAMWVCYVGLTLLPILSSIGLFPAERGEGTLEALLALPVARRRILISKTLAGLLLCVGPLALAAALSVAYARGRETPNLELLLLYARSILTAVFLFIWMLALTARLPSEARAGLVAAGVLICWELATAGLSSGSLPPSLSTISPLAFVFGFSGGFEHAPSLASVLLVQLIIAAVLWLWTIRQITPGNRE